MARTYEVDTINYRILNLLLSDARMVYSKIARQIQVSTGAVHMRMSRLGELGIVRKAILSLDLVTLGYGTQAYGGVCLLSSARFAEVTVPTRAISEVTEAYFATGPCHIFTCIRCYNNEHLRAILRDKTQQLEGVERTETPVLLDELFSRPVALSAE